MSLSPKFVKALALTLAISFLGAFSSPANADTTTEERFQDLFVTAGYSAAFGAALGAAFLAFEQNPSEKLQYISVGASLGFIGGSLAGTYIIFQPMFGNNSLGISEQNLIARNDREGTLVLRPYVDTDSKTVNRIDGVYTFLTF